MSSAWKKCSCHVVGTNVWSLNLFLLEEDPFLLMVVWYGAYLFSWSTCLPTPPFQVNRALVVLHARCVVALLLPQWPLEGPRLSSTLLGDIDSSQFFSLLDLIIRGLPLHEQETVSEREREREREE